jgi:hypothetical protein
MMTNKPLLLCLGMLLALSGSAFGKDNSAPSNQWYVSVRVSVVNPATGTVHVSDNPAVFGKLEQSEDGRDRHDIKPYGSIVRARAAAGFIHDDWGDDSGQYLSDYRKSGSQTDTWVMTVFSSVPGGVVTLKWNGLYELTENTAGSGFPFLQEKRLDSRTLEDLSLIDLDTGEIIPAITDGALNTYAFTMDGATSRNFRWVLGPIKNKYFDNEDNLSLLVMDAEKAAKKEALEARANERATSKFGAPPH